MNVYCHWDRRRAVLYSDRLIFFRFPSWNQVKENVSPFNLTVGAVLLKTVGCCSSRPRNLIRKVKTFCIYCCPHNNSCHSATKLKLGCLYPSSRVSDVYCKSVLRFINVLWTCFLYSNRSRACIPVSDVIADSNLHENSRNFNIETCFTNLIS